MLFEIDNVGYRYSDGTPALRGISFGIRAGSGVALLGANGSGKSTLLRLMSGLLFPAEGAVRFQGKHLTEDALRSPEFRQRFRQSVGFVFQNAEAQLFNATVYDEVAFGLRQHGHSEVDLQTRVDETLAFLGIEHLADRAPFRLSGGEKRKVAIASVLSMNPQVILFDEPFLGLDPRGQSWLVRTLLQLQGVGKTTIIATHTLDLVARIAEEAVVLGEDHRLLAAGPVSEVFADDRLLLQANLIEDLPEVVSK